jgi:hypothetical protein
MKVIRHQPVRSGAGIELRTEPENRPGLGTVDVLLATIHPQDGQDAVHARFLSIAAEFHDEFMDLLRDLANVSTAGQVAAIKARAAAILTRIAAAV